MVLTLLFLPHIIQVETWYPPWLEHEKAIDLLVNLFDSGKSWVAYETTLMVYLEQQ